MKNGETADKPKVCFFFSTTEFTGAAKMGYFFAKAFESAGYQVTAICGARPSDDFPTVIEPLRDAGIDVIEEHGFESFMNLGLLSRIHARFKELRPRAVICMFNSDTKLAALAARWLRIPFFVSVQNHSSFFGRPVVKWLKQHIYSYTVRLCVTRVICTSEVVKERLALNHGLREDRMCVLPNGIETAAYRPQKSPPPGLRSTLSLPPDAILFVNVGRIGEQKGQQLLVRAFAAIKAGDAPVHLLLIGDPTSDLPDSMRYAAELREWVAQQSLGDKVHFLGWRDDVAEVLGESDVYVHSALWEGWALAPLEAMASSLPTIMTDCSGCPTGFVTGVDGYVIPAGKVEPLAEAMASALRLSSAERRTMGTRGQHLVEQNYDVKEIGRRFVEIIRAESQ